MLTTSRIAAAHVRVRLITAVAIYAFIFVGLALALSVPETILERAWAASFVKIIATVVPFVEKVGQISRIPQIAQFFSSVMWILAFAIATLSCFAIVKGENPREHEMRRNFQGRRLKMLAVLTGLTLVALFIFAYPVDGHTRLVQLTINSRTGLAVGGTLSILVIPLWAMTAVTFLKHWGSLWNGPAIEEQRTNGRGANG